MDPIKSYEYLVLARRQVFDWVRPLLPDQYVREFPIEMGTLGRTLTHIYVCEFAYAERIRGHSLPPYEQWPIQDEKPPPFPTLEAAWQKQAEQTRDVLATVTDWNEQLEYRVTPDLSNVAKPVIVTTTPGGIATQMLTHEVHHRAQAMAILRQLGVAAQDLDYNTFMFQRREA